MGTKKYMVKTLVILILLFDGTLLQERYDLSRPMDVHECLMFADDHREVITTYKEFEDSIKNGFYLNDGRGHLARCNLSVNKPILCKREV